MRELRRVNEAETIFAGLQTVVRVQHLRGSIGEIVEVYKAADHAVDWSCIRCDLQPLIKRSALVGLEVAEADPAQLCGIDDLGNHFTQGREHGTRSGMEEQGLFVFHQEMVELQVDLGNENGKTINIRRDFEDAHATPTAEYFTAEVS